MSTIDSGHHEALYEQTEEAVLGRRREARDLRAGDDAGDVGCAALCGQCEPYFLMLKDPRFAPVADAFVQEATFLPVEIEADAVPSIDVPKSSPSSPLSASRVDITLSDDRRILVEGPTALISVVSLVQGLAV